VVFDPATHVTAANSLWSLYKSGVTKNWRLVLPVAMGSNYEFSAYVRNAGLMTVTPGQAIRLNATLRVSGAAGDFVDTVVLDGLSADDQARLDDLRNRESRGGLSADDQARLDDLRNRELRNRESRHTVTDRNREPVVRQ